MSGCPGAKEGMGWIPAYAGMTNRDWVRLCFPPFPLPLPSFPRRRESIPLAGLGEAGVGRQEFRLQALNVLTAEVEVPGLGVVEDQGAHRAFRVHHVAVG